jgi:hypothetical protein
MQFASGIPALPDTPCTPSLIHPDAAMGGHVSMASPAMTPPLAAQWRSNCAPIEQRARKDAIPPPLILESFDRYEWIWTARNSLSLERSLKEKWSDRSFVNEMGPSVKLFLP